MSSDDDQLSEISTSSSSTTTTDATDDTTADANNSSSTTDSSLSDAESSDDVNIEDKANYLTTEDGQLGTEDPHWDLSPVPDLVDIIIDAARYVKGPELKKLMENADPKQRKRILELLPLDIPLNYSLATLDAGEYWKRQCLEKWSPRDIWRYHDNWKIMFVELTVETSIANFVPGESDIEQLKDLLLTFKEYIKRLKIAQLKKRQIKPLQVDLTSENFDDILDDFLSKPESSVILIDFEVVFECLSEIKGLSLVLTPCSMDLNSFHISVADFNSLLRGLKKLQKLENFRCSNGILTKEQINIFSCLFIDFKFLKELNLSSNFIDDACCDYIGKLIMSSCPLEVLVLRHNRIGDDGVVAIASGLSANSKLKRLDLSLNWIRDFGAEFLSKVVSKNVTLEGLDVSNNKFGRRAGLAFVDMLMVSKSVRSLNVSENDIGKESGRKLKDAVEVNRTILNLRTHFCHICPEDEDAIYHALKRNLSTVNYDAGYRYSAAYEFKIVDTETFCRFMQSPNGRVFTKSSITLFDLLVRKYEQEGNAIFSKVANLIPNTNKTVDGLSVWWKLEKAQKLQSPPSY